MTGSDIWDTFISAGIPSEALKQLGHDLFFERSAPTAEGITANNLLAQKLQIDPRFMFMALKVDPDPGMLGRKQILEQLAYDYGARRPWDKLNHMTTWYVGRIAFKVNIINGGKSGPTSSTKAPPVVATAAAAKAAAPVAAPVAKSASISLDPEPTSKRTIVAAITSISLMIGVGFYKTFSQRHLRYA